jgi:hypothetical protein
MQPGQGQRRLECAGRQTSHPRGTRFDSVDGEIVQHLPILREDWVISLRGLVQPTLDDDDIVPFFLLPSLGSGDTLRGYASWRFSDRHSLLMTGELHWIPNRAGMDVALFYDAAKVTNRRRDLDFKPPQGRRRELESLSRPTRHSATHRACEGQ